ncbi:hypothetical protein TNCV_2577161 [Trichonephila clavipes]|nr:hypothetical protein TNCV_2577161 [Trichonephila clavipes]
MVKVTDLWSACQESESSITEDLPCRGAIHVKSVENSNVLPMAPVEGVALFAQVLTPVTLSLSQKPPVGESVALFLNGFL